MAEKKLEIRIEVDTQTGKLKLLGQDFDKMEKTLKKGGDTAKRGDDQFRGLANAFGFGAIAARGFEGILAEAVKTLRDGIQAAMESEVANRNLGFTLLSTKKAYYDNREEIQRWTESLAVGTQFTKTELVDALANLVKFTGDLTSAQKLLLVSMEGAKVKNRDLKVVTEELGYAVQMGSRGMLTLRRTWGDLVGSAKTFDEAMNNLYSSAKQLNSEMPTTTDETKKLQAAWNETIEDAGRYWLPTLTNMAKAINDFNKDLDKAVTDKEAIKAMERLMPKGLSPEERQKYVESFNKAYAEMAENAKKHADAAKKSNEALMDAEVSVRDEDKERDKKAAKEREDIEKRLLDKKAEMADEYSRRLVEQDMNVAKMREEITTKMVNKFSEIMVEMADTGNFTSESLQDSFGKIAASFKQMLIQMLAEYASKAIIMSILNAFTGGTGGTLLGTGLSLIGSSASVFNRSVNPQFTPGNVTQVSVNALDLRSIDNMSLNSFNWHNRDKLDLTTNGR